MLHSQHLKLIRSSLAVALIAFAGVIATGCGGGSDEVALTGSTQNTALTILAPASLPTITVGTSPTFSATVTDPDGIQSVSATIDGVAIPLSNSGTTYSLTLPATLSVGSHVLMVTGKGLAPDGTVEVPRSASVNFTVYVANTAATASPVVGPNHYTVGATPTFSTTVTDPDGIASVTATLDGVLQTVTKSAASYGVTLPGSVATGTHTLVFTVTGLNPDGTPETALTVTQTLTVYPVNTALVISSVTGPTSYTVGTAQTYIAQVVDPDTVASVAATLDGVNVTVTPGPGSNGYSVNVPASVAAGLHSLVFTATGRAPDGSLESPKSVTQNFRVYVANTPATASPVVGPNHYTVGTTPTFSTTVTDPDGIASVTATLDGMLQTVTQSAASYGVTLPGSVATGTHTLAFTVTGLNPNGAPETALTVTQTLTVYPVNTPLVISSVTGPTSYTVGTAQTYTVQVVDPDTVDSVSATLDGVSLAVTSSGSNGYSVLVPASVAAGSHTLVFTGVGRFPDGSLEPAHSVSLDFSVYVANTPLTISPISGPGSYTVGAAQNYSTQVVDPDGVVSVTATLDGVNVTVTPGPGSTGYSVNVTANLATGPHTVAFTATGRKPDGTLESPQTITKIFTVYPVNTLLTISPIDRNYGVGNQSNYDEYFVSVVDPDGIASVTATFQPGTAGPSPQQVNRAGSTYSIRVLGTCRATVTFTATGLTPSGTLEAPQTQTVDVSNFC